MSIQKKMFSFIYENYAGKLTLDEIAASGGVCRSKCCQIFKKYLNNSPIGFLNLYRLEVSQYQLIHTDISVTEIALSLSSIAFYSRFPITSAIRRSFLVASGFGKFLDLDRCYSVSKISVSDGSDLCIYSVHMSAYGNDESVREGQMKC